MSKKKTLPELRDSIDALDKQVLDMLNQRAQLALEIGEIKRTEGSAVFRPEREAQVIASLKASNLGPLQGKNVSNIWREIMSACRSLESPQRVAFLGPSGTFSEEAALRFFGSNVELMPMTDFDEIFHASSSGAADFGVVPVENSSEGVVTRSLDLLLSSPLHIVGEVSLLICHNLLALEQSLNNITTVAAHPQALAQCQRWLKEHLPKASLKAVPSNAEGARLASQTPGWAAIGSERAANIFGLCLASRAIQDNAHNQTRFVVVCLPSTMPLLSKTGRDCTSLILSVPNKVGAVHDLLTPLKTHGVSMSRFESRPARSGHWEYFFYIDLLGHPTDVNIANTLTELEKLCTFYKLLGSYPLAD